MENRMRKLLLLKIVNPLLGLAFLTLVVSLPFVAVKDLWVQEMSQLHKAAGMIFTVLAIVHIILNWSWITHTFFRKTKSGE